MRIIGGRYQRRLINPPAGLPVRPTTDKAKEALFNILNNNFDFEAIRVLDLFSGTGNISFEFASRGAKEVVSIEKNHQCVRFMNKVKKDLELSNLNVIKSDTFRFLNWCKEPFDIIFADPPYNLQQTKDLPAIVFDRKLLVDNGWLIIEHSSEFVFDDHAQFLQKRKYSLAHFSFFGIKE
ncbi:MAG: methyltransferase domain-containing protein [Bacteroidia bacterium]|nr:MAG: methyltransferase domain-containing protein [Bacteroidia bacterium]